MLKRLISMMSIFLLAGVLSYGDNPLKGYVDEESFKEGEKTFQEAESDIFREPAALDRDNSEEKLRSRFPQVVSVVRTSGSWNGTFYFVKGEGKTVRKTVRGSSVIKGTEDTYAVTVFNEGIRVRDIISGITTEIKIKRR